MMHGEVTLENGWDAVNRWLVYDWNSHRSSCWIASTYSCLEAAITAARDYALANDRRFHSAEIVPLRPRKEVLF